MCAQKKKAAQKKGLGVCAYCGAPATTRDHIPPKCLFGKLPANLITVPSCDRCNKDESRHDTYFRDRLVMRGDVGEHPEAQIVVAKLLRGLGRPEQRGYFDDLWNGTKEIELRTPAGIIIGPAARYSVELARLNRVVRRVVLGLFYHHFRRRLPTTHDAAAYCEDGMDRVDAAVRTKMLEWCKGTVQARPLTVIGHDVFAYSFQAASGDPDSTFWVLVFYKQVGFVGYTYPKTPPNLVNSTPASS